MPEQADCQSLTEHIQDWKTPELLVDARNRIVKNVVLAGLESSNGYRYSEAALRNGVPLYQQKPVFLDHAASQTQPHRRSTRDLVGSIINARYENGRIRGDIRVLDTEAGRTFLALAETNGPAVGMSHVILAEKNADGSIVEKIHEVVSVDAVVFPATTKSFQEQTSDDVASLASQRDAIAQDLARLQTQLTELETRRDVELLLAQSPLPPEAITELFRQQLRTAPDSATRTRLLEERLSLVESLSTKSHRPQSQPRWEQPPSRGLTDEQLIAAIKR